MDTTQTIDQDAPNTVTVELLVHHGNYRETFTGTGATPLEAAEDAANQTSYASGLFDENSSYYEERGVLRTALEAALLARRTYTGFGWTTFKLVGLPTNAPGPQGVIAVLSDDSAVVADSPVDQDKIPDAVDAAVEAGAYPKLVSDGLLEQLIEAHAVAVRKDSIRLFPQSYNEATALEPFLIEARRTLTKDLESVEYAYAALQMQK